MTQYLNNHIWHEIENVIGDLISKCPPICFYIDAVDEEFAHAPMYWQRCQKGLFYQVMRFLRDSKLGGRLHIIICIRDIVLSAVHQSEHATRYWKEPHIRTLSWNNESIKYFIKKKISYLDKKCMMIDSQQEPNIMNWLGIGNITNGRGTKESIMRYLIRHTRSLPRDVVILGNMLCNEVFKAKNQGKSRLVRSTVRKVVSNASAIFAREQIQICANQITSDQMPKDAAIKEYSDVYTSSSEYIRGVSEDLIKMINSVGKDLFNKEDLVNANELCNNIFGKETDVMSTLWQSGLLGYTEKIDKKKFSFFHNYDHIDRFVLPLDKEEYIFHSCLSHLINLKCIENYPIDTAE